MLPVTVPGTALLVIDVQNAFCDPDGARSRMLGPGCNAPPEAIVAPVVRAVRACRQASVPIWFTRMIDLPDDASRQHRRFRTGLERAGKRIDLCPAGSWDSDLVSTVAEHVVDDTEVVIKHRASAFYGTTLDIAFRAYGIHTVVLVGTTTSYCVAATILDLRQRDLNVIVLSDATADSQNQAHDAVLSSVRRFGEVATVDELAAALAQPVTS